MSNKFFSYCLALSLFSISSLHADSCRASSYDVEYSGRSYIAIHPQFQSSSPEMVSGFRQQRLHAREEGLRGAFQAVAFGGCSIENDKLQHYFTPFGKKTLIVDERPEESDKDILAGHFNIFTHNKNFRSKISFYPKQTTFGLGLHYRQSFWRNDERKRGYFVSISTPLTHIKNEFRLIEQVENTGGGPEFLIKDLVVADMREAFTQENWKYGRIESKIFGKNCIALPRAETKLADIETKIGMEWLESDPCHLESYIGILIPTGNKSRGNQIFETIVGNGGHPAFMTGASFGALIWEDERKNRQLRTEYAIHSEYLFRNNQVRSFDLKNKPFSRYIELYAHKKEAELAKNLENSNELLAEHLSTPGINILTQQVAVTPGFQFNMTTAVAFTDGSGFQAEGGYNYFARRAEEVRLRSQWQEGPAIKHLDGSGKTNPVRDITGNPFIESIDLVENELGNYDNNIIKESDLDLSSAASPAIITHTYFGAVGYHSNDREYPLFGNLGGSYEFSRANNAHIERWTVWFKMGASF